VNLPSDPLRRVRVSHPARTVVLLAAALLAAGPAAALYKVVQPDGSVTYTDRSPAAGSGARITSIGSSGAAAAPTTAPALPAELRQAVQRYPVTLYATPDCPPCDSGRQWLQRRGVPYVERSVTSVEDGQALQRLVGGRTLPALTVGPQPLQGFMEREWADYLDAAGYPRESKLPGDWPAPTATPLVERVRLPAARVATPAPPPPAPAPTPAAAPGAAPAIRF
jgi:glutaredoxin